MLIYGLQNNGFSCRLSGDKSVDRIKDEFRANAFKYPYDEIFDNMLDDPYIIRMFVL